MNRSIKFPRLSRLPIFWVVQTAIWTFAVLVGVFIAIHWGLTLREALSVSLARAAMGFCATGFLFRPLLRRLMTDSRNIPRLLLVIFAAAGVASGFEGAISHTFARFTGFPDVADKFLWMSILIRWPLYIVWGLLYWLFCEWRSSRETALRLAQAEAERAQTELDLLRAQVDPHFLFNVLNTILGVADDPQAVAAMTGALSEHLVFSLHRDHGPHTLRSELTAVENYLQLEKYRFEENLLYRIDIGPELLETILPLGTLLLPVENAVKYGQRTSPRPLRVEISGRREKESILLEIRNTGAWVRHNDEPGLGIGLANLRKTVSHFGGTLSFPDPSAQSDRVTVAIRFPIAQPSHHARQPT